MQESQKTLLRLENLRNLEDQRLLNLLERIHFIEYIFQNTPNDPKLSTIDLQFKQVLAQAIDYIFQNTQEQSKGFLNSIFSAPSFFQSQSKPTDEKKIREYKQNLLNCLVEFKTQIEKLGFEQNEKLLYLISKYQL